MRRRLTFIRTLGRTSVERINVAKRRSYGVANDLSNC
jgi:hypothetical protein